MLTTMTRLTLFRRRIRLLSGDDRGVSAVEFGLIAPMMVGLFVAAVVFCQGIAIQRKTTMAAHAVADLVSQAIAINNDGEMVSILNAVDRLIEPYPKPNFKLTVSQVTINAQGVATIQWSDSRNGAPRPPNQVVTSKIPATFLACAAAPCYLLWGEAEYVYVPVIGTRSEPPPAGSPPGTPNSIFLYLMGAKLKVPSLKEQSFMRPRQVAAVTQTWTGKEYPRP